MIKAKSYKTTIFLVNEFNFFTFCWHIFIGKPTYVLGISPYYPPTEGWLCKLVGRIINTGRSDWIVSALPEYSDVWEYIPRSFLFDIYARTEIRMNDYFSVQHAYEKYGKYSDSYKLACNNYMKLRHFWVIFINAYRNKYGLQTHSWVGLSKELVCLYEEYYQEDFGPVVCVNHEGRKILKIGLTLCIGLYSVIKFIKKFSFSHKRLSVAFAADFGGDSRDVPLYQAVGEKYGAENILIVKREKGRSKTFERLEKKYRLTQMKDGVLNAVNLLKVFDAIIVDLYKLSRASIKLPFPLYYSIITAPHKRANIICFLGKYNIKRFWGRDDYSEEHILRYQELKINGGVSFGISHGFPAITIVYSAWRYIYFDYYYVLGKSVFEKEYKQTWLKGLTLRPITSFAFSEEDIASFGRQTKSDIVVLTSMAINHEGMIRFVRDIAREFDDRKVLVQMKGNLKETEGARNFEHRCTEDSNNVEFVVCDMKSLLMENRYIVSDVSTSAIEAMQARCITFIADVISEQKETYFRCFPRICLREGREFVDWIKDIEAEIRGYPFDDISRLADLRGEVFYKTVLKDMSQEDLRR